MFEFFSGKKKAVPQEKEVTMPPSKPAMPVSPGQYVGVGREKEEPMPLSPEQQKVLAAFDRAEHEEKAVRGAWPTDEEAMESLAKIEEKRRASGEEPDSRSSRPASRPPLTGPELEKKIEQLAADMGIDDPIPDTTVPHISGPATIAGQRIDPESATVSGAIDTASKIMQKRKELEEKRRRRRSEEISTQS